MRAPVIYSRICEFTLAEAVSEYDHMYFLFVNAAHTQMGRPTHEAPTRDTTPTNTLVVRFAGFRIGTAIRLCLSTSRSLASHGLTMACRPDRLGLTEWWSATMHGRLAYLVVHANLPPLCSCTERRGARRADSIVRGKRRRAKRR